MKNHHCYVSALDVGEQLPFTPVEAADVGEHLLAQKKAQQQMEHFVELLHKHMGEAIHHLGVDTVESKSYHRFMFQRSGFFEIMVDAPIAINAHFHDKKRARKYLAALRRTIKDVVPHNPQRKLFLSSIMVEDEHHIPLQMQNWVRIHKLHSFLQRSITLVTISLFLFAVLEFTKAILTEAFTSFFGVHEIVFVIVTAVLIAFFFKPIERLSDHIVSRFIFRK